LRDAALELLTSRGLEGDVRVMWVEAEYLTVENGSLERSTVSRSGGVNVRVWGGTGWGFAASQHLSLSVLPDLVDRAATMARAAASTGEPYRLAEVPVVEGRYITPVKEDPFALSLEDKLSLLFQVDEALNAPFVRHRTAHLALVRQQVWVGRTDGTRVEKTITQVGAGFSASALSKDGDLQVRSYPQNHGGNWAAAGWEFIRGLDLPGNTVRVLEELQQLMRARPLPAGEMDLVILSDQMALQVHESVGHALELDRILGFEASYAGTSFVRLEDFGRLRYGSPHMNITADGTTPGGLGTFGYDDEGVPAQKVPLIREGVLVGALTSRDTAPFLPGARAGGTVRAETELHLPILRMTNINLEPGDQPLEALIEGVEDGVLLATNRSWSIDMKRLNFQFSTEIGWRIRKGRVEEVVRNPVYTGMTPEFWARMDAVGDASTWHLWGVPNCGKGEPPQTMGVGHGTPAARFRRVRVGSAGGL